MTSLQNWEASHITSDQEHCTKMWGMSTKPQRWERSRNKKINIALRLFNLSTCQCCCCFPLWRQTLHCGETWRVRLELPIKSIWHNIMRSQCYLRRGHIASFRALSLQYYTGIMFQAAERNQDMICQKRSLRIISHLFFSQAFVTEGHSLAFHRMKIQNSWFWILIIALLKWDTFHKCEYISKLILLCSLMLNIEQTLQMLSSAATDLRTIDVQMEILHTRPRFP